MVRIVGNGLVEAGVVLGDEGAQRCREQRAQTSEGPLPLVREGPDEDREAQPGSQGGVVPELAGELLLVVQEEGLGVSSDRHRQRLLLTGVPMLDLVAEPDEEPEVRPDRLLLVRPPLLDAGASSHCLGSPSTLIRRRTFPAVVQYRKSTPARVSSACSK